MSNERNINELLSAYFDGEVTAEERARVEQFLEESVEARRDLDQIDGLSESLNSLPDEPAPQELLPSIMRRAERETLLAIAGRARTSSSRRKSWLTVVAGIAVAAASVMLMMQFLPNETGDTPQTVATNDSSSQQVPAREPAVTFFADDSPAPAGARLADAVSGVSAERANDSGRSRTAEVSDREASPVASPAKSGPVVAKLDERRKMKSVATSGDGSTKPPAESRQPIAGRPATIPKRGAKKVEGGDAASADRAALLNSQVLKRASRGDVLQFFDSSGTKVTTYLVTVVDVKQAMNKLQLLLARHDIPPQQPLAGNEKGTTNRDSSTAADNKPTDGKAKLADEADERTDRLFAVYIETTPGRFASALKDLLNEELFAKLSLELPVDEVQIQVADLGQSYQSLFFQPGNARLAVKTPIPRKTASPSPAQPLARKDSQAVKKKLKPDRAESSPAAKTESPTQPSGSGRAEERAADKRRTAGSHIASRKPGELRSFQLQVQLAPRDANVERLRSARIDQLRSRDPTRKAASPAKNQALAKVKQQVVAEDRPSAVRVLFVFREVPRQTPQP